MKIGSLRSRGAATANVSRGVTGCSQGECGMAASGLLGAATVLQAAPTRYGVVTPWTSGTAGGGATVKMGRLQAAVTAGIARRGYLRGMAAAKGCKVVS